MRGETISQHDYQRLAGLLAEAEHHYSHLQRIEGEITRLLGDGSTLQVQNEVWGYGRSAEALLRTLGVTVTEAPGRGE